MVKIGAAKESLADKAFRQLKEMIVTLRLKPDSIVSEYAISKELGIGRMPVRDAFRRLEAEGLVSILPQKGIHIRPIRIEETFLQLEVRGALEDLIVRRACRYADEAERAKLLQLAEQYRNATDHSDKKSAIEVDSVFNELLGECAKNPFASEALLPLYARFQRIYYQRFDIDKDRVITNNLTHIDLMRHIAAGREEDAVQSLRALLKNLEGLLRGHMSSWLPEDTEE